MKLFVGLLVTVVSFAQVSFADAGAVCPDQSVHFCRCTSYNNAPYSYYVIRADMQAGQKMETSLSPATYSFDSCTSIMNQMTACK